MPVTGKELVRLFHAERVNNLVQHGGQMELRLAIEEVLKWQGVNRSRAHIAFVDADLSDLSSIGEIEDCARSLGID